MDMMSDVYFGGVDDNLIDWRNMPDAPDPDDGELLETPEDIVRILGFDPKEFDKE